MRIEIGSAYTLVFLLLIVPVLWAMQAVAHWIESRQGSLERVI
jgi:putative spermidine/putrescine transport system permease protein